MWNDSFIQSLNYQWTVKQFDENYSMWFGMRWWYSKQWTEYNIENNMWNNKKIYVFIELWCSMGYATVHNNILTLISATFEGKNTKNAINYIFCLKLSIEIHTGMNIIVFSIEKWTENFGANIYFIFEWKNYSIYIISMTWRSLWFLIH